ncbi:MAG: DEAD/DEAH box helicase family protein [Anaerolineales bacterium]
MVQTKFDSSDYYHYAKRAEIYGLEGAKEALQQTGWKLSQNHGIDGGQSQQALRRIANIPKLATTCFSQDCPKCNKLVEAFGEESSPKPWRLNLELYRWQKEAQAIWKKEGGQGIARVVTGAGKTILALGLMDYLYQKYPEGNLKTIIVVPTTALLDQWYGTILSHLNIPKNEIGTYYGEAKDDLSQKQVML